MEFSSVPIIVICAYLVGEVYKYVYRKNDDFFKFIPIVLSIFGGLLGVLIYLTTPSMIKEASSIWSALLIGIISGTSSTGLNQIFKQLLKDNKK